MYNQEIVYKLGQENQSKTCYRDKDKCNRYWFEFPPEWRTSLVTERIIGFRSLWVPYAHRLLRFSLKVYYYYEDASGIEHGSTSIIPFVIYVHIGEYFEEIVDAMRKIIKEYYEANKAEIGWEIDNIELNIVNEYNEKYNGLVNCFKISQIDDSEYELMFQILDMNDDAKAIFNYYNVDPEPEQTLTFSGIWTRHRSLLRSSISVNNCKNYLGQSQKDYNPIKYYKIQCNENRFYIDLLDAHDNTTLVNLPVDDKEDLILEMVIPLS